MRIKFLESRKINSGQTFEIGMEYDMTDADAARWVRERRAEYVQVPVVEVQPEIEPEPVKFVYGKGRKPLKPLEIED